jgi:hypothetical protein
VEKRAVRHVSVTIFAIENLFDAELPAIAILRLTVAANAQMQAAANGTVTRTKTTS